MRVRLPRRAGASAGPAGHLQQRRQRRRALRPPTPLRCRGREPLVGLGDRRHRPRRRRGRGGPRSSVARPAWPASWATSTSRWTACSRDGQPMPHVQLRLRRRRRERRLAHRHRQQPAAVLADPVPRSSAARRATSIRGGQAASAASASAATRWPVQIFEQQAMALGRLFTIAANFTDPDAYFVGGGVVEAAPALPRLVPRAACASTRAARGAGDASSTFALVPDLDMAGARGAAIAALQAIRP